MNNTGCFQSKWFERCIRDYLGIGANEPITKEDLSAIKYLYVGTTHDYELAFGKCDLPKGFYFEDAGDEWNCCCVFNPGKYSSMEEFIKIIEWGYGRKILTLRKEIVENIEEEMRSYEWADESEMNKFHASVKRYHAEPQDFEGLEEDEETCDWGILNPEDFAYLTGLETIRFMDCEVEIHRLDFLQELANLKVLELGQVCLENLDGIEKFSELEALCIWPEFYY